MIRYRVKYHHTTMQTQNHDVSAFILGLALALEKVRLIVSGASPNLKAFLLDFSDPKAGERLNNLFAFMWRLDSHDGWIDLCKERFSEDPVSEEGALRDESTRMFEVIKKTYPEDSVIHFFVKDQYRRAAEETYARHQPFYDRLIRTMYQNQPSLGFDFGIVFVDQPE